MSLIKVLQEATATISQPKVNMIRVFVTKLVSYLLMLLLFLHLALLLLRQLSCLMMIGMN